MASVVDNISQKISQNAYKISGNAGLFAVTVGRFAFGGVLALGAILNIISNIATNNADKTKGVDGEGVLYPSKELTKTINAIFMIGFAALAVFNSALIIPVATAYIALKTIARTMQHVANGGWRSLYKDINLFDFGGVALFVATAIFSPAYILVAIGVYGAAKVFPSVSAFVQAKYASLSAVAKSPSLSHDVPETFKTKVWLGFVKVAPVLSALGATALIGASSGLLALSGIVASNFPAIQGILPFITAPFVTSFAAYDYLTSAAKMPENKARSTEPEPILAMTQSTLVFHAALGAMRLNPAISLLVTFGSLLYGFTKLFDPNLYQVSDEKHAEDEKYVASYSPQLQPHQAEVLSAPLLPASRAHSASVSPKSLPTSPGGRPFRTHTSPISEADIRRSNLSPPPAAAFSM